MHTEGPTELTDIFTARKRSLRRLCFYRCLSVHTGGVGMRGFIRGVCVVLFGEACMVLFRGHVWFYLGGVRGFIWGGMHGFIQGAGMVLLGRACVVLFGGCAWFYSGGGGMCGFFSFFGYNEIRSMSRWYTSYWNAFLFYITFQFFPN